MKRLFATFLLITCLNGLGFTQIVINELFPDPSPALSLPEEEFIELRNISNQPIDLINYTIEDPTRQATITESFVLQPNALVVICANSSIDLFLPFGDVIGVSSFPSLNNASDELTLRNAEGEMIDLISYNTNWYKDELKDNGGWTLERINPLNNCDGEANWAASTNAAGGTPGQENAIFNINYFDNTPIQSLTAWMLSETQLELALNKAPTENLSAEDFFSFSSELIINAINFGEERNKIIVEFNLPVVLGAMYEVQIIDLPDCNNLSTLNTTVFFGIPVQPKQREIIINEILFNPISGGVDFVEIANTTTNLFALDGLTIAEMETNNSTLIDDFVTVANSKRYLFPEEIIVFTSDTTSLSNQYEINFPAQLVQANIPNYNNEEGIVTIFNRALDTLDQLHYYENWHFEGLNRFDGVSLERLNKSEQTQDKNNWFSASSSVGFASPTDENSQQKRINLPSNNQLKLSHEIFTPDQDGVDDFLTISFSEENRGATATIQVYNVRGLVVKTIVNNQLIGAENEFRWTGLNENNEQLPLGHYIILAQVYDTSGNQQQFKKKVVLSRRR